MTEGNGKRLPLRLTISPVWLASALLFIAHLDWTHCQNDLFEETAHLWPSDAQADTAGLQLAGGGGGGGGSGGDVASTRLTSLDVICGKEYMTVRAEFNSPFNGIVFSKGTYGQSKCVYVKPHSGLTHLTFNVRYDECGTKPDLQGKYFENTIVFQYGNDIIDVLDEAKRLRCEWFEAYEKPATFRPAIPVADLDVIEMNFQGDEIDCFMSIQEGGKGPYSNEINRIVTVGQPLSLVVAINDQKNQFDMKVKSCFAHDGVKSPIYLVDEDGCVLRPGMFSQFQKFRSPKGSGKATLVSYASFLAFKFPDSVDVQIQCTVEVCRHGCSNNCEADRSRGAKQQQQSKSKQPSDFGGTNHYQLGKPNSVSHEMNRFLMENADLLESASSNEAATVTAPVYIDSLSGGSDSDSMLTNADKQVLRHNSTAGKQSQLNNIAAFVHNVEQPKTTGDQKQFDNSKIHAEFNVMSKLSSGGARGHQNSNHGKLPPMRGGMSAAQSNPLAMFAMATGQRPGPGSGAGLPPRYPAEPVAQVLNIPLSPMYMPGVRPSAGHAPLPFAGGQGMPSPNMLNSQLNSLRLLKSKGLSIPQLFSNYFGKNRRAQYVPNDNFEFVSKLTAPGVAGQPQQVFRTRRFVRDTQGEVGLKRGFQVVTSLDLSFSPNMSADQMPEVYEGIPAPIVYGMCFSTTHFMYFVAVSLLFLFSGISSCVYIIVRLERAKKANYR